MKRAPIRIKCFSGFSWQESLRCTSSSSSAVLNSERSGIAIAGLKKDRFYHYGNTHQAIMGLTRIEIKVWPARMALHQLTQTSCALQATIVSWTLMQLCALCPFCR